MINVEFRQPGEQFGFGREFKDREAALKFVRETEGRARFVDGDGVFMNELMNFVDGKMVAMAVRMGDRMVSLTEQVAR
jgi:hypothetical protein